MGSCKLHKGPHNAIHYLVYNKKKATNQTKLWRTLHTYVNKNGADAVEHACGASEPATDKVPLRHSSSCPTQNDTSRQLSPVVHMICTGRTHAKARARGHRERTDTQPFPTPPHPHRMATTKEPTRTSTPTTNTSVDRTHANVLSSPRRPSTWSLVLSTSSGFVRTTVVIPVQNPAAAWPPTWRCSGDRGGSGAGRLPRALTNARL